MTEPDSADYGLLADVWESGRLAGFSTAMRRMSDEPTAPSPVNPYKCYGHELCRAPQHIHGCYADVDGTSCDDPSDHAATPMPSDLLPCCLGQGKCQAPPDMGPCAPIASAETCGHMDPDGCGCDR